MRLRCASPAPGCVRWATMTTLEEILLGAMGTGIVGLAGFAARILWVILPRYLEQNERNTHALQWIGYTMGQLPVAIQQQQAHLERVLTQNLLALRDAFREEHARTRAELSGQVDELSERIERRISGQEEALQQTQLELARSGATGKHAAVSAQAAEAITHDDPPASLRREGTPPPPPRSKTSPNLHAVASRP